MTACGAWEILLGRRTAVRGAASPGGCPSTSNQSAEVEMAEEPEWGLGSLTHGGLGAPPPEEKTLTLAGG